MITKEQVLQATGDKLSKLAGEVLHGGKHDFETDGVIDLRSCSKCYYCDTEDLQPECLVPLTWPIAMKWRDWAVKEFGADCYASVLQYVCIDDLLQENTTSKRFFKWVAIKAQPEHFVKAACLCKLDKETT